MFDMTKNKVIGFAAIVLAVMLIFVVPMLVENVDAKKIMVLQTVTGDLVVHTEPGPKWQGLGKVTNYNRQAQYTFCSTVDHQGVETKCDGANSTAKRVRFSEGGHALLNGAVSWEMPLDAKSIIEIHKKFNSEDAIEAMAIGKMIDSATYFSGPLMTSTESSGGRRGELVQYINDQAEHGIYVTQAESVVTKDLTGGNQTVTITKIMRDKAGLPLRQQGSILDEFNIKLLPISINELKYDSVVEKQIADRQSSTTQVQLAMATALKAEQQAKTVEAEGKAKAATAKWEQETIKAKEVTLAQQKFEVSVLAAKEAEQYKRQQILIGEGNATKQRLEMQANGALEQKLAAAIQMNKDRWEAIAAYKGNWVPSTVMGGQGGTSHNGAQQLIDMLSVKTARELSVDLDVKK